jgi:AcrR family transcriptional regulator
MAAKSKSKRKTKTTLVVDSSASHGSHAHAPFKPAKKKRARSSRNLAAQQANRRHRRAYIMGAAAKLFSEFGYHATTMDQVSELTKLNKGTIYYYYKSKADILYDMCTSASALSISMTQPAFKMERSADALMHTIDVLVRWVVQQREYVQVYFQESRYFEAIFDKAQYAVIREQQKQLTATIYKIIAKGCESGEFRPVDVTTTGRFIVGLMMWVYRWPENDIDCDKAASSACELVLQGLQQSRGLETRGGKSTG